METRKDDTVGPWYLTLQDLQTQVEVPFSHGQKFSEAQQVHARLYTSEGLWNLQKGTFGFSLNFRSSIVGLQATADQIHRS